MLKNIHTFLLLSTLISQLALARTSHAEVTISSLPFRCDRNGETYTLKTPLTASSGPAIEILAQNIILDGLDNTITYATTAPGTAIQITTNVKNVQITRLSIVQGPAGGPAISIRAPGISALAVTYCQVQLLEKAANGIEICDTREDSDSLDISRNAIILNPKAGTAGHAILIDASSAAKVTGRITENTITMGPQLSSQYPSCLSLLDAHGPIEIASNNLVMNQGDTGQGIRLWNSDGHLIHHNSILMNGAHMRGILIDGGSDYNRIYDNTVLMRTLSGGASAGIRVRYASSHNLFYTNTIDASSAQEGYAIRYGGSQSTSPQGPPSHNEFFSNTLISSSRAISIEESSSDTLFYCNSVSAVGPGYPLYFYATDAQPVSNLSFSYDEFKTPQAFSGIFNGTGSPYSNVLFCSCRFSSGPPDQRSFSGIHLIESGCPAGPCSQDTPDTQPPGIPTGLRVLPP